MHPSHLVIFEVSLVFLFLRSRGDAKMLGSGHPFVRVKTAGRFLTFNVSQHRNEHNQKDGCLPLGGWAVVMFYPVDTCSTDNKNLETY